MKKKQLKRVILEIFANGSKEFHGYAVHRKLLSQNIQVELSRLYRILHEMLSEGLLEDHWERSRSGPNKRVYWLSRLGREMINNSLSEIE